MSIIFQINVKCKHDIFLAGKGRGTSLAPQTVSSQRLDEIDGLQCSDFLPQGRAASVVLVSVRRVCRCIVSGVVRQIVKISMHRSNSFHGQLLLAKIPLQCLNSYTTAPRSTYVSIRVASPLMYFCIISIIWLFK